MNAQERTLFEQWRETAPWFVVSKTFVDDADGGETILKMMNLAASSAWSAALALADTSAYVQTKDKS